MVKVVLSVSCIIVGLISLYILKCIDAAITLKKKNQRPGNEEIRGGIGMSRKFLLSSWEIFHVSYAVCLV